MSLKSRRAAAVGWLGAPAAWITFSVIREWQPPRLTTMEMGATAVVMATVWVPALALARSWWWARMVCLLGATTMALGIGSVVLVGGGAAASGAEIGPLIWAAALIALLSGRTMFQHYEGSERSPLDWHGAGMTAVRWALVTNIATALVMGCMLYGAREGGLFRVLSPWAATFHPALIAVAVLGLGLVLLCAQRTAGLLITAAAALALPILVGLSVYRLTLASSVGPLLVALPGVVLAWVALGVWARPMLRFLRQ